MRVQNNITVFTGDTQSSPQAQQAGRTAEKPGEEGKSKTFYAGNFMTEFPLRDRIAQRKAQAQERAMKIVSDAWDADRQIDDEIKQRRENIRQLQEDNRDALENLKEFRQMEDDLREGYGVAANGQEQQDLELLKRSRQMGYKPTEEEKERLEAIGKRGLTNYQTRALELDKTASFYRKIVAANNRAVADETEVIESIRAERNKYHPMTDAQAQAEDVMAAARDEVIGMVTEEAKEHLDEEQKEREEQAEAIEEKKKEQEEIQEKRDEREKELEELIDDMPVKEMTDLNQTVEDVKQQVQKVLNDVKLLEEDIKGTQVDASL